MKSFLPVFAVCLLLVFCSSAQTKKTFAVTGETFGSTNWIAFREIDLTNSKVIRTLFVPSVAGDVSYDAATGSTLAANPQTQGNTPCGCATLNSNMVAAAAFDNRHNRIYFTNMSGNQLRYLDISSMKVKAFDITGEQMKTFAAQPGEASVITRMCMAPDGLGYALTNDGNHLIQFSTAGKNAAITDLGALKDAGSISDKSVHTFASSWGGDMIADKSGNLFLFTVSGDVFKINIATKQATFVASIKGLPEGFTVNAVAVNDASNVVVGTSILTKNYYKVDLNTWSATALPKTTDQVYNVSDFANESFAFDDATATTLTNKPVVGIYPNPVTHKNFTVKINNLPAGVYTLKLSDGTGKPVLLKTIAVKGAQSEQVKLPSALSAGRYSLQMLNDKSEAVYTTSIIAAQ